MVSDEEIVDAMRLIMTRMKVVVEPSGAAGLAAVLSPAFAASPRAAAARRVGVVLCGGNLDFDSRGFWDGWAPAAQ